MYRELLITALVLAIVNAETCIFSNVVVSDRSITSSVAGESPVAPAGSGALGCNIGNVKTQCNMILDIVSSNSSIGDGISSYTIKIMTQADFSELRTKGKSSLEGWGYDYKMTGVFSTIRGNITDLSIKVDSVFVIEAISENDVFLLNGVVDFECYDYKPPLTNIIMASVVGGLGIVACIAIISFIIRRQMNLRQAQLDRDAGGQVASQAAIL